ncbi:MAG: response regulator [Opitutaceae bacterium]|nr:response regulator [Opitutaceae bacterium]
MAIGFTFLIVDDDQDGRFLLERALVGQFEGAEILSCASAQAARAALDQTRIDAIVTDNKLGGESGVEFIRGLRQRGITCPVVVVTGSTDPKVERAAYEAGANKVFSADRGDFATYLRAALSSAPNERESR